MERKILTRNGTRMLSGSGSNIEISVFWAGSILEVPLRDAIGGGFYFPRQVWPPNKACSKYQVRILSGAGAAARCVGYTIVKEAKTRCIPAATFCVFYNFLGKCGRRIRRIQNMAAIYYRVVELLGLPFPIMV